MHISKHQPLLIADILQWFMLFGIQGAQIRTSSVTYCRQIAMSYAVRGLMCTYLNLKRNLLQANCYVLCCLRFKMQISKHQPLLIADILQWLMLCDVPDTHVCTLGFTIVPCFARF